ncbi:MAG: ABC transporter permease subunit [Bacteroidota bacterium]
MITTIIEKELRGILLSPKFTATFAVCSALILLSVYAGVKEYNAFSRQYEAAIRLTDQEMREETSIGSLRNRQYRPPDPMQIFVAGVHNDVGRLTRVHELQPVKLTNSVYADEPIYAVFRFVDFAFIVQVILSLFAILFTYDAIAGERENGTLQLTFANGIPRVKYLLGKIAGLWIGLAISIIIPILLGIFLVVLFNVPLTATHWARVVLLIGVSLLYFTFFVVFGVMVSAIIKRTNVAFLVALVAWVAFILIIPRAGVMAAAQVVHVPSIAEIEGQRDAFARDSWARHWDEMEGRWKVRNQPTENMNENDRGAYRDEHMWEWMEEDEKARKQAQRNIDEFGETLNEDLRNRKLAQERLAYTMSRLSPASAFQLVAMKLAGTDVDMKTRFEDALRRYRGSYLEFVEKKQKESGGGGGIRITMDSDRGFSFQAPREAGTIDLSELPRLHYSTPTLAESVSGSVADLGVVAFFVILSVGFAFAGFLRSDLR